MSALSDVFARCASEHRRALVGYLPAGYPTINDSIDAMVAMVKSGCDVVEVGVAYSDPTMDGPVIQDAAEQALARGVRVRDVFSVVEAVHAAGGVPVVMTYWNPVLKYGVDAFSRDLAAAGGCGLITPNLIPEEADAWIAASDKYGLDRIFLVAPSSSPERIDMTCKASSGFIYAASTMGVTGARDAVSDAAHDLVSRIRQHSDIPVGVGLGVKTKAHVAEIAQYADAVIVGSALVTVAAQGARAVEGLCSELAEGVRL